MKIPVIPANKLIVSILMLCAFFGITARVNSQTVQLTVDSSQGWIGYMTAVNFAGTNLFANTYPPGALQAYFVGTNLDLLPCTNVWETTDDNYVQGNGTTPNANMDANMYVQNDALVNTNLVFSGTCVANTLTTQPEPLSGSNYTCWAFIKAFSSSYALLGEATSNLIGGKSFSITLGTTNAAHVQYGFETIGPDANPSTAPSLGDVVIAVVKVPLVPTNNAPVPTNTAPIVAMYDSSGVYPVGPVDDWDASWSGPPGPGGETGFTIGSNVVLEYTGLQYAGVEFYSGDAVNTAGCNEMHVSVWTPNANQFGIQLVSLDSGTQAAQVNFTPASGTIVSNKWISLNIPLSQFLAANSTLDLSDLQQLLWIDNQGGGVNGGTFYIDNVYFYSNSALAPPPPPLPRPATAAATPPATNNMIVMYDSSGAYSTVSVVDWDASWSSGGETAYTVSNSANTVLEYVNLQYAGVEFYNAAADQINASSDNMMHVDVWTPIANQLGIQLVSLDNGGTQAGQVNFTPASGTIVSNQWVGLDIPLTSFTSPQNALYAAPNNNLDLSDLQQLLWIDNQGGGYTGGYFYIDNVYFYQSSVAQQPRMAFSITSGTVNVAIPTEYGFTYTLQYTTSLTNPSWQSLGSVSGNNYIQSLTDTPGQTRFYRIAVTP